MSEAMPDPAALLRRLVEIDAAMYQTPTSEIYDSIVKLRNMIHSDLIPALRRAVELEGENARLRTEKDDARSAANGWKRMCEFAQEGHNEANTLLSTHYESAASALAALGITPGPDPVQELCGVVPGMVAKMREALNAIVMRLLHTTDAGAADAAQIACDALAAVRANRDAGPGSRAFAPTTIDGENKEFVAGKVADGRE